MSVISIIYIMNLFEKTLNPSEAMHIDSLFNKDGFDADVLLVHQAMQYEQQPYLSHYNPQINNYNPNNNNIKPNNDNIQPNNDNIQPNNDNIQPKTEHTDENSNTQNDNTENRDENDNTKNKKNKYRHYIKLPNATISKHKHKYRESETKRVNEIRRTRK